MPDPSPDVDSPRTPPDAAASGERFEILRPLGRGAFGRTLLALDRRSNERRALKLLDPTTAADWKARELFSREATVLGALRHRGIPQVFDVVEVPWKGAPTPALVMEYIEGESLAEIIGAERAIDPADAMRLFMELLDILEYLHTRVPPVLHRDIKPANVLVRGDGTAALVDFGSVRHRFHAADDAGSTVVGTYGYMPYEQYMGHAAPSSDLFSLGATFLHLLTGRAPREFMHDAGVLQVPADLPGDPRLSAVVTRVLRASPAERYASAREARMALLTASVERAPAAGGRELPALPGAGSSGVMQASPSALPRATSLSPALHALLATPAPRQLDAVAKTTLRQIAPSAWQYMDSSRKRTDRVSAMEWLGYGALSVATLGIMPIIFHAVARNRRVRLQRFMRAGTATTARVLRIESEKAAFGEQLARVQYEFEADGVRHRDSDFVLPFVASRWEPGDMVHVLYIADDQHDSVIIGD